jgi:hypothetical protein
LKTRSHMHAAWRRPAPRDPRTPEEWQESADIAQWGLTLDAARQYGLVTGGPVVNVDRCQEILDRAAEKGIRPRSDAIERMMTSTAGATS